MHPARFDRLARSRPVGASRRSALAVALGVIGLGAVRPDDSRAKKKAKPNQFGCLNVGQPCGGKDSKCCSGICQGKKPKKGKKDKSRCAGHNEGGCSPERNVCTVADPAVSNCNASNETAVCFVTTGSGVFCGNVAIFSEVTNCRVCAHDSDCTGGGFPPGSACVLLSGGGPACTAFDCAETNFRACVPPGI